MPDADKAQQTVCFVDSNIWLYAFINDGTAKHELAAKLIQAQYNITISTQVINEVSVNLIKKAAFKEADLRSLVDAFYSRYRVLSVDQLTLRQASQLRELYQLSYWDSLIVTSALSAGAKILFSEDMQNGLLVEGQLRIVNPLQP